MLRKFIGLVLRPNPVLALFASFVTFVSGLQVIALIRSDTRWDKLSDLPILELAGLVGLILIALLLARSLVSDLWNGLAHEKRIICGSGQAGTSYDYHSLLSRNPKEVIVVAQNMRTLLSDKDFLPSISAWLARNKDRGASLTFILSTPMLLGAHSAKAKEHLRQSVIDLKRYLEKEPLREMINIRFHPGANSLSAFFCEPKSKSQGIVVFTPKWALDVEPANRLFCVI